MSLRICDLNVSLSNKKILHDINLYVEKNEFFALFGASGCGKTTLLKTLAGLVDEDAGDIFLGDKRINNMPPHLRKMTLVFQDLRLFPHLNALDNIAFPLKMIGISKKERHRQANEMLDSVSLSGFGNRRINEMSGGQQQRVALARAIIAQPEVLLLDEPLSSLDEALREEMRALLLNLHNEYKMTTVLVTHDRHEACELSDRMAAIADGRILKVGEPAEVFNYLAAQTCGANTIKHCQDAYKT
ncbi:MAG: ABC transporter ATP-binding protein [Coriobacteriales bacterium]|jgi:putative spermidine/putrescine transport system ATP-binding protein|nr:ABC transporter ATP-binding protein [Coriobacteriales bacterium]